MVEPGFDDAMVFGPLCRGIKFGRQVACGTDWDKSQHGGYRPIEASGNFLRYRMISRRRRGPNSLGTFFSFRGHRGREAQMGHSRETQWKNLVAHHVQSNVAVAVSHSGCEY
jgi:hypothetical protein